MYILNTAVYSLHIVEIWNFEDLFFSKIDGLAQDYPALGGIIFINLQPSGYIVSRPATTSQGEEEGGGQNDDIYNNNDNYKKNKKELQYGQYKISMINDNSKTRETRDENRGNDSSLPVC